MNSGVRSSGRRPLPVLITLANAGRARREKRARQGRITDPFAEVERARRLLAPLGLTSELDAEHLRSVSELAAEVSAFASALVHGTPAPDLAVTNDLATKANGRRRVEVVDGDPYATTVWNFPTAAVELAHRVIDELEILDRSRLRECARPECTLLFYDTTRSNTQRWHAEDPCGWYERQARHRRRPST